MATPQQVLDLNRAAWERYADGRWSTPVSPETIAAARRGEWEAHLIESKPVPRDWFPELRGADVLALAAGGGQQGPILAAAGAKVTVLDSSPAQLARDRSVAERDQLDLETVHGDMTDLSRFADERFDLVFHPVANHFVPDVRPLWREAFRVLKPGGVLLAGFLNPVEYIFDWAKEDEGMLEVARTLPFSSLDVYGEAWLREHGEAAEYSHSLEAQVGGQLAAGFRLTHLLESHRAPGTSPKGGAFPELYRHQGRETSEGCMNHASLGVSLFLLTRASKLGGFSAMNSRNDCIAGCALKASIVLRCSARYFSLKSA